MEDNLDFNETEHVSDTWNKVLRDCKQIGFREGAFDGQDQNFQKSFDIGYNNGFQHGFNLGKYKGNNMINGDPNTNNCVNQHLKATRKAFCVICEDSKLFDVSVEDIVEKQDFKMKNVKEQLEKESAKVERY